MPLFIGSTCDGAWFEVEETCFQIFVSNVWDKARKYCLQQGGDLAVVDSEIKRQAIASRLTVIDNRHPHVNIGAHIGLRQLGTWQWLGGRNISASVWHPGYPHIFNIGECAELTKGSLDWKLSQTSCHYTVGFLCETNERK